MWQCRRGVAVVAALAAMLLGGCASAHHPSPAAVAGGHTASSSPLAGGTTTRFFAPYRRSGAPTAGVVAHRSGSCFTKSITVAARGAFRCFAANTILDPCFAAPGSEHVVDCYAAPWTRAVELRVAKLPSTGLAAHVTRPWAIELAGGQRCVVTNGTAPVVQGIALGYQCADGAAGLRSDAAGRSLSALYRATDGALSTQTVQTAWRAG